MMLALRKHSPAVASKPVKNVGVLVGVFTNEDRDDFIVSPSYMIPCRMLANLCNRNDKLQQML